jgi:hypothetical protein
MIRNVIRLALSAFTFALVFAVAASAAPKTAATHEYQTRWPAENLTGTIDMVIPAQHLVVVKDSTGTTFDFVVNHKTHILDGSQSVDLAQLSSKMNDQVKVHFIPESKGDMARTIQLAQ